MATLAELQADLTSVQAAIAKVEGQAQEVGSAAGGRMRRAELQTLYDERDRLRRQIEATTTHPFKRAWVGAPVR